MEKYDIVILAGQSNAVGFGCGESEYQLKHLDRIVQLYDDQAYCYQQDENGNDYLPIYRPWKFKMVDAAQGHTTNLAMRFADDYIVNGLLAKDRKLLILRCAVGGTGFCTGLWGVGNLLCDRMLDMIQYAQSLNFENRVVALLWHQGECDAFEKPDWSFEKRKDTYYNSLKPMIELTRTFCGQPKLPFLCGGFTDEWSKDYREPCDAIIAATKQVCEEIGYAAFMDTAGLLSSNQTTGNGDTLHFCVDASFTMGHQYFLNYLQIVEGRSKGEL